MNTEIEDGEARIRIVEEQLNLRKDMVETGRVHVSSRIEEENVRIQDVLSSTSVRVERKSVELLCEEPPALREEADRVIVPVYEEVLVKRFSVRQEIHLIVEHAEREIDEEVPLRRNHVEVTREGE